MDRLRGLEVGIILALHTIRSGRESHQDGQWIIDLMGNLAGKTKKQPVLFRPDPKDPGISQ